jgi:hypothetical protein
MDITTTVIVALVVLLAIGGLIFYLQQRRTSRLKDRFGPEYQRTVEETGAKRAAEAELAGRAKRVAHFDIHPLEPEQRGAFVETWRQVQADFVDDPAAAVTQADDVLGEVMTVRGYPVSDFDQRSADLSVDHPTVVQNYRAAHDIALRHERGDAGTEDLRQAMIHYRALFDELIENPDDDLAAEAEAPLPSPPRAERNQADAHP